MRHRKQLWLASVAVGSIATALAAKPAAAQNVNITVSGATGGVTATATGTHTITVTVTKTGSVNNPTGPGISLNARQGAITVSDSGPVTGTQSGIVAINQSPNGVTITANANVVGGVGDGVAGIDQGSGNATVTIGSGNATNPIMISNSGSGTGGVDAFSLTGDAAVKLGSFDTVTSGSPGNLGAAAVDAIAGFTTADTGGPSAKVTLGTNDTITFVGNAGAAVTAHTGLGGLGGGNGSASAAITIGNGVSVHASGFDSSAVFGFVADPSGKGLWAGSGNVGITIGTGQITVDEAGAINPIAGSPTNSGVFALSGSGNVSIDNASVVTVSGPADATIGLGTNTGGAGASLINSRASVTSTNGDAIKATTAAGANTVNVLGGNLVAANGDGVDAISGAGAITIATSTGTDIHAGTPGFFGIAANSASGSVAVTTRGTISDGGIDAVVDGGAGNVSITVGGAITTSANNGVTAQAAAGSVTIVDNAVINAAGSGIVAINGQDNQFNIVPTTAGISVGVNKSMTVGGLFGVGAASDGSGTVSVTTANASAANPLTIAGATSYGVAALGGFGPGQVSIGNNNVINVDNRNGGDPGEGADVLVGSVIPTFVGPGLAASLTTGTGDSFTFQGNDEAALTANLGSDFFWGGGASNTGDIAVTVGNNVSVHASGYDVDGIYAFNSDPTGGGEYAGSGNIAVKVGTGAITVDEAGAEGAPGDLSTNIGIGALGGGGNVSLDNASVVTVSGGLDKTIGLYAATTGSGAVTVTSRASVISNNGDAIQATTAAGVDAVNVTGGTLTATGGDGIDATSTSGVVTVTDKGTISATGHGILATSSTAGAVTVSVGGSVVAGNIAVEAENLDIGAGGASISTSAGTSKAPLVITSTGTTAVAAVSLLGPASVSVGGSNLITAGAPGAERAADVVALNVVAPFNFTAAPSAQVTTGTNDTFVLQGDNSAAISAQIGQAGESGPAPGSTDSVMATVGNGVNIHASGLSDAGVIGFVTDPSGLGTYAGQGAVSVTVGTGVITVDEVGAAGNLSGDKTNTGVAGLSSGGNVLVDDAAVVSVSGAQDRTIGLWASTTGAGSATVNARASVTSGAGDGIQATTVNGLDAVNVLGGTISATGGDGIDATASGVGAVTVNTSAGTTVGTTTPGAFFGILGRSGSGPVTVNAAGAVNGGVSAITGLPAVIGAGAVNVTTAAVTNTAGIGVNAEAAFGPVSVTTNGVVTASDDGVFASGDGPSVSVTINKNVTSGGNQAVNATDNGSGAALVTTASAASKGGLAITGPVIGVEALSIEGKAGIQIGNNNSVIAGTAGGGGAAVVSIALVTEADTSGPSTSVVTGTGDSFTFNGNNGAGISAQVGLAGGIPGLPFGIPSGTASSFINVGNGVSIHVSGLSDAGVIGFVSDPSGAGAYFTAGDVSVTVGTGAIVVNETGTVGNVSGAGINVGVAALSTGGDVLVDDAATVNVSGGQDIARGLSAVTGLAGTATVNARASVTSLNGDGIYAATGNGADTVDVFGGTVSASGGDGVDATAAANGAVTVITAVGTTVTTTTPGSFFGILAQSGSGPVTVNAAGTVNGGISAITGASAPTSAGAVSVTTAAVNNTAGVGVNAIAELGSVSVTTTGAVNASGDGVFAQSNGTSVTANIGGKVTSGGAVAVDATDDFTGAAVVNTASAASKGGLTISGPAVGLEALSVLGRADVFVGANNSITAGTAGASGADVVSIALLTSADSGGFSSSAVVTGTNDSFTFKGNNGAGISAQVGLTGGFAPTPGLPDGTASAAADVGNGATIRVSGLSDAGVIGFVADPSGAGAYSSSGNVAVIVGTGTIVVNESGAVGNVTGAGINVGVAALSGGGDVVVDDAATVNVTGGQDISRGLSSVTTGGGTSTVNARASVTSHTGDAIYASTANGANVVNVLGGAMTGTTDGVDALSTGGLIDVGVAIGVSVSGPTGVFASSGSGPITVDNFGTVKGGAVGGVVMASGGAMTVTNETTGVIGATGSATSPAISGSGAGLLTLDNYGAIGPTNGSLSGLDVLDASQAGLALNNELGGVMVGTLRGSDNVTFNNAGTWQTSGTSDFGTPANASTNVFNNTGTLIVGQSGTASAANSASFLDLGAFNNDAAGGTGTVTMMNSRVGDKLTVSGLFTGATGYSNLDLDVFLGGPGSKADQLILQGGSAGQTLITINDTNTGQGALNSQGILLVQGASHAGDFALNPNQPGYDATLNGIDKGVFVYPLVYTGGNEVLLGEPGLPAMQMASMASAAEQVWSSTTPGDQSANSLRLSLAGGDVAGGDGMHVWMQALNGGPSRLNGGGTLLGQAGFSSSASGDGGTAPLQAMVQQTSSFSAFGMTYGFDTSYSQSVSALVTGLDLARHVGQNDAWSWGVSTGYLESQQSFTTGGSVAAYQGAMAALHGAYVSQDGFYVAGDAKVTALQVSYITAWGGGSEAPKTNITTMGAEGDAGWKHALGGGWSIEPNASFSMQSSSLGSLVVDDTALRFGAARSARIGFGAKLDGDWRVFGMTLKNESSLKIWDELEGANVLQLGDPANGFSLPDQIGGVFTDAADAVSLDSSDGKTSAFVSGAYRWNAQYQAAQLSAGFKLRW